MNDSVWAIVAGTVKGFKLPVDYVLYELSYANLILLGATLPSYKAAKDRKKKHKDDGVRFKADDPANRERFKAFLNSAD